MNFHKHTMRRKKRSQPLLFPLAASFALIAVSAAGWFLAHSGVGQRPPLRDAPFTMRGAAPEQPKTKIDMSGMTFTERQAVRLKDRLSRNHTFTPTSSVLSKALEERNALLREEITVSFTAKGDTEVPYPWTIRLREHQSWVRFISSVTSPRFVVDSESIAKDLREAYIAELPRPRDAKVISQTTDSKGVTRVITDELATAGYVYDTEKAAVLIATALRNGQTAISWEVERKEGTLEYTKDGKTHRLTLLASGLSDWSNSPDNRVWNVNKVFNERLQGVVIPQNGRFSFNDTLGGPVTLQSGWKEAMGLFGGGAAPTPGAGICQGATTVYRSAMLSGLPFVQARNHSLFVDHYEKYGIGLDATIFPGIHDLVFTNDTPGPIVMQTYLKGDDAIVNMYGIDDGRSVTMKGPYFAKNAGKELKRFGRAGLTNYEIAWIRQTHNADGTVKDEELIVSRYAKPLWNSLVSPYVGNNKALTELYSAAPAPKN
jgi:vancomycin resistance protein YoaR